MLTDFKGNKVTICVSVQFFKDQIELANLPGAYFCTHVITRSDVAWAIRKLCPVTIFLILKIPSSRCVDSLT